MTAISTRLREYAAYNPEPISGLCDEVEFLERRVEEMYRHINRLERILTNERLAYPRLYVGHVRERDD